MCETNAFLIKEGKEELLLEDVTNLKVVNDKIELRNILGQLKNIEGKIKEINFLEHKLIITQT